MPRYQNTAIYLSAERLIAEAQRKKPWWQRISRRAFFLSGLASGLTVALVFFIAQPRTESAQAQAQAATESIAAQPGTRTPLRSSSERAARSATASATTTETVSAAAPLPVYEKSIPAGVTAPAAASGLRVLASSSRAPVARDPAPDTAAVISPLVLVGRTADGVKLRGELRLADGTSILADFKLFLFANYRVVADSRYGGRVEGAVVLAENGRTGRPFAVSGYRYDNTLSFVEVPSGPKPHQPIPNAYAFTLHLPKTDAAELVTGDWVQGGIRRGELTLRAVPWVGADSRRTAAQSAR